MKKFSKRFVGIMLTVIMALSLAVGCGSSQGTDSKTEGNEKTEGDKKVIGVSLLNCTHVFYNNIQKGLENKAEELGWELIIQDAAADANKQLSQVQDFITQDVDAIIICPTNSAGSKSMVELADEADIPVFTMDIESEIEACIQREKGFTDYLAENAPDVNVVDIQNYSGDQQKAADVMQNMLLKHENIDVVFAVGDPAAIGAQSSIDAAGKDTLIIGYDGNPEGIEAIKAGGNWVADVAQDPTAIAEKTLEAVKTKLEGGTPEKEIKIEPYIIDKENAE
ncbi:substrate-binding domain-containing protein [Mediterraneibacter sp. ICN-202921]|uniref:substrate-binding domain-containing protein n=1 Tax=Mediterraneibacter sp. ICN-202921 TaxID=3134657 RepID=UPI0030C3EECC